MKHELDCGVNCALPCDCYVSEKPYIKSRIDAPLIIAIVMVVAGLLSAYFIGRA